MIKLDYSTPESQYLSRLILDALILDYEICCFKYLNATFSAIKYSHKNLFRNIRLTDRL